MFIEQDRSEVFFYLPSTIDRCEEINKYMTSVHLRPFNVRITDLGEDFNPAQSFDRASVVNFTKKVEQSMTMTPLSGQVARGQFQISLL